MGPTRVDYAGVMLTRIAILVLVVLACIWLADAIWPEFIG